MYAYIAITSPLRTKNPRRSASSPTIPSNTMSPDLRTDADTIEEERPQTATERPATPVTPFRRAATVAMGTASASQVLDDPFVTKSTEASMESGVSNNLFYAYARRVRFSRTECLRGFMLICIT